MKWTLASIMMVLLVSLVSEHGEAQPTRAKIENQPVLTNPSTLAGQYTQAGGWTVLHNGGGNFTCASGTANTYTISGNASLVAYDTASPDYIMFHDATITANNAGVCGHIF